MIARRLRSPVVLAVGAVLLAAVPGAHAQGLPDLPIIPPPAPPNPDPGRPPAAPAPTGPEAAAGEVVSYRGNPQGDQVGPDNSVFGPLQLLWNRKFENRPVGQPLVVGGRVLVNIGACTSSGCSQQSQLLALDPRTGQDIWSQPTPGGYFTSHIASNAGTVVSLNYDGVLRAFSVADGTPLWEKNLETGSVDTYPVAARGVVYILGGSTIIAISIADGSNVWRAPVPNTTGNPRGASLALDAERVYAVDESGGAYAFARSTGQLAWSRDTTGSSAPSLAHAIVSDGRVLAPGKAYDAASGADRPAPPGTPAAAAGGLGFSADNELNRSLTAFPLDGGANRWTFKVDEKSAANNLAGVGEIPPYIVGPTIYLPTRYGLIGLDRESGELLSSTKLDDAGHTGVGGTVNGMAASGGVLLIGDEETLTAYEPILRPEPRGADLAATAFDILAGRKVGIVGGFGREVFAGKPEMVVEQDRTGRGKWATTARGPSLADGTGYFDIKPNRNTLYRITGAGTSRNIKIYVYPSFAFRVTQTSRTRGRLKLKLKAGRDFRPGGRVVVAYLGRARQKRYDRLGTARLRNLGKGRAQAFVPFKLVRKVGGKDFLVYCVKGLDRAGWGRSDAFQKACGRRRIKY